MKIFLPFIYLHTFCSIIAFYIFSLKFDLVIPHQKTLLLVPNYVTFLTDANQPRQIFGQKKTHFFFWFFKKSKIFDLGLVVLPSKIKVERREKNNCMQTKKSNQKSKF